MCDIPVAVADHERVVRAVFSHHLNKNKKIREYLFSPGCGPDEVSVMRHSYLGTDACRKEACKVKPANPAVRYKGLAIIAVEAVRNVGSDVIDSREGNYCGHAHISHGIRVPAEEPLRSELKLRLDERLRKLRDLARYFPDPDPLTETWTGEAVEV
jgi:hypothetical protein